MFYSTVTSVLESLVSHSNYLFKQMVEVDEKSNFNLKQFSAIAAFSERLLFSDFA